MNAQFTTKFEEEALNWFEKNERIRYLAFWVVSTISRIIKSAFYASILVPLTLFWLVVFSQGANSLGDVDLISSYGLLYTAKHLFGLFFFSTLVLLWSYLGTPRRQNAMLDTALKMYQQQIADTLTNKE